MRCTPDRHVCRDRGHFHDAHDRMVSNCVKSVRCQMYDSFYPEQAAERRIFDALRNCYEVRTKYAATVRRGVCCLVSC